LKGKDYAKWVDQMGQTECATIFVPQARDLYKQPTWVFGAPLIRQFYVAFDVANDKVGLAHANHDHYKLNKCKSTGRQKRLKGWAPAPPDKHEKHHEKHHHHPKTAMLESASSRQQAMVKDAVEKQANDLFQDLVNHANIPPADNRRLPMAEDEQQQQQLPRRPEPTTSSARIEEMYGNTDTFRLAKRSPHLPLPSTGHSSVFDRLWRPVLNNLRRGGWRRVWRRFENEPDEADDENGDRGDDRNLKPA